MPRVDLKRRSGPRRKPRTKAEAQLQDVESQIQGARRRISGKDRQFIALFAASGFRDADGAAKGAGFKEAGIGWKLASRLSHLIDAERVRSSLGSQMELDEALRLTAEGARDTGDRKIQAVFLQMILRVHGAMSDKPLPVKDRLSLSKQVTEIIDKIQRTVDSNPGARVRLKAMLGASIEADVSNEANEALPDPSDSSDAQLGAIEARFRSPDQE